MHISQEMYEGMDPEQRTLMERLNIEVMICHAQLRRAGLRPGEVSQDEPNITAEGGRSPNITGVGGRDLVSDDATMLEVLTELREATEERQKLRQHLRAVIDATRAFLHCVDVQPGHGVMMAEDYETLVRRLLAVKNALFTGQQLL